MKLIDLLKTKFRRIKKVISLKREIKKRGGKEIRDNLRGERIKKIHHLKESIKNDLYYSWRIGDLKRPDEKDWKSISIPSKIIPISFLIDLKKKYWGGNIYNEL